MKFNELEVIWSNTIEDDYKLSQVSYHNLL